MTPLQWGSKVGVVIGRTGNMGRGGLTGGGNEKRLVLGMFCFIPSMILGCFLTVLIGAWSESNSTSSLTAGHGRLLLRGLLTDGSSLLTEDVRGLGFERGCDSVEFGGGGVFALGFFCCLLVGFVEGLKLNMNFSLRCLWSTFNASPTSFIATSYSFLVFFDTPLSGRAISAGEVRT